MKNLSNYPSVFFDIAETHARGENIPMLSQVSKQAANSNQRLWHKFRSALMNNKHPLAEAAHDLICSIANAGPIGRPGVYFLSFDPRGAVRMARELKGLPPEEELPGLDGLISPAAPSPEAAMKFVESVQPPSDPAEDYFAGILKDAEEKPKG